MSTKMGGDLLLLMAKEPAPGRVKTRLGEALGMEAAADLARALLGDSLTLARSVAAALEASLRLVHAPDEPSPEFREWLGDRGCGPEALRPQGAGSLGQRLARAARWGPGRRVFLGMDAPDLAPAHLEAAFEALNSSPLVVGPAGDGGYHLLGLGPGVDGEFLADPAIRWSSPHTLDDTLAAAGELGAGARRLASHDDVDDLDSLAALARRLAAGASAPETARWLSAHPEALR